MSQRKPSGGAPPVLGSAMRGVIALVALIAVAGLLFLWRDRAASPKRPDLDQALGRSDAPSVTAPAPDGRTDPRTVDPHAATPRYPGDFRAGESAMDAEPLQADRGSATDAADLEPAPAVPSVRTGPATMPTAPPGSAPRVAVVIDDLGRSVEEIERFASLGIPLSYSVLPFETRTGDVVRWLRDRGEEILCHLPMEPEGGSDPGPGALYRSMTPGELVAATQHAIAQVPGAVGANNHMGSKLSSEPRAMRAVLGVLHDRGLFYLDSRTTAATVGYDEARSLGMPAARRHVFLDNDRDPQAIRNQLAALLARAAKHGSAIGIAHPYPETVDVLAAEVEAAIARGFRFVPASSLTDGSAIARR